MPGDTGRGCPEPRTAPSGACGTSAPRVPHPLYASGETASCPALGPARVLAVDRGSRPRAYLAQTRVRVDGPPRRVAEGRLAGGGSPRSPRERACCCPPLAATQRAPGKRLALARRFSGSCSDEGSEL